MKYIKQVIRALAVVLAAGYLTWSVYRITLNTTVQVVFVACYFLALCVGMAFLKKILFKKTVRPNPVKDQLLALALALIVSVFSVNYLIPEYQKTTLTIYAGESAGQNQNLCLARIVQDGQEKLLSDMGFTESLNWIYNAEYDDMVFVAAEQGQTGRLTVELPAARSTQLIFAGGEGYSQAEIQWADGTTAQVDCTKADSEGRVIYEGTGGLIQMALWEKAILYVGALITLQFTIHFMLMFWWKSQKKENQ